MSTTLDRPLERAPINKAADWRFLGRSADFWLCAAVTVAVLFVQGWNIAGYPRVFDDEGTYLAQAWAIDHGIGMTPYTYWFDHPPMGWMQVAALAWIPEMIWHAPGQLVVAYARVVMLPFTVASSILVYVLARRMTLPKWAAALAVLLFGLSPLSVTLQREIFLDNIAVTWILAAFVLAYSPRKHLWAHVASGLCAGIAVLSKETMLLAVPALVVALWQNVDKRTRKYSFVGFIGAFLLLVIQYPLYAILKGELWSTGGKVSLIAGLTYQLSRPGSGSIFTRGSNSYSILHNWLFYDPVLIVAGTVAVVIALAYRHLRPVAIAGVVLVLTSIRPSGYLPAMYIIQMLPFFAIAVAGVGERLVSVLLTYRARPVFWQQVTRLVAVAACVVIAFVYMVPRWYSGDKNADTQDLNTGYAEAVEWVHTHIPNPGDQHIVADDTLWLDMLQDGFKPSRYDIYFFKLDVDPEVMSSLGGAEKNKWKSIQWVIQTPYMWENATQSYTTEKLLQNSKVVWYYGSYAPNSLKGQESDVEIRKVIP
ncbi:MAG TPA: glycosyltransferase family 39 protein [Trebonia sp.]|nr:glycosyltransferase family 39 protein [Trebonia sp.]